VSADEAAPAEVIVVHEAVSPDVMRLSDHAAAWAFAREDAIADGLVERSDLLPPSNTNLALLPVVPVIAPDPVDESSDEQIETVAEEPDSPATEPEDDPATGQDSEPGETGDPGAEETPETPDESPTPEEDPEPVVEEPEPQEPPEPEELIEEEPTAPTPPAQVNGRVPPPNGGPTAAQWDALRRCESTHNYRAISPSGLYRGAYQFSQQTWDWVAGIHQPHLVGIDPIDAEPAWQDIMAYTLYAMRGWDQWPVCGKFLL